MLLKCCTQYVNKSGKLISSHKTGKYQFSFQSQRKAMPKNVKTTSQLHSPHTPKVMLKILQARLQQYMNHELPDVQVGFRKGRGNRDQISNIHWIIKKARELQRNIQFSFTDYAKAFDCVDHHKLWKILKEMGIPDHLPVSCEVCLKFKKQYLDLDMEKQIGSKSGKEYVKPVYCHPAYLTYMQNTSCEMQAG